MQHKKNAKRIILFSLIGLTSIFILINVVNKYKRYRVNEKILSESEDVSKYTTDVEELREIELRYLENYLLNIKDTVLFKKKYAQITYNQEKFKTDVDLNYLEKDYLKGLFKLYLKYIKKNKINQLKIKVTLPENAKNYPLPPPGIYYGNDEFGILPSELKK